MIHTKRVEKQKNDESFNTFQFMDYLMYGDLSFECFNNGQNGITDLKNYCVNDILYNNHIKNDKEILGMLL